MTHGRCGTRPRGRIASGRGAYLARSAGIDGVGAGRSQTADLGEDGVPDGVQGDGAAGGDGGGDGGGGREEERGPGEDWEKIGRRSGTGRGTRGVEAVPLWQTHSHASATRLNKFPFLRSPSSSSL